MQSIKASVSSSDPSLNEEDPAVVRIICVKILTKQHNFMKLLIKKGAYLSRSEVARAGYYTVLFSNDNIRHFDPLESFSNGDFDKPGTISLSVKIPIQLIVWNEKIRKVSKSASIRIMQDLLYENKRGFHELYLAMPDNKEKNKGNVVGLKLSISQIERINYYVDLSIYSSLSEFLRISSIDLINDYFIDTEGRIIKNARLPDKEEIILSFLSEKVAKETMTAKLRNNFIWLIDNVIKLNKKKFGSRAPFLRLAITRQIDKTELLIKKMNIHND